MSVPRTTGILETPCVTLDDCKACIREIIARGLLWHFEDDPAETVDRSGRCVFTEEEAAELRMRAEEFYEVDADEWGEYGCPIGYALAVEEESAK